MVSAEDFEKLFITGHTDPITACEDQLNKCNISPACRGSHPCECDKLIVYMEDGRISYKIDVESLECACPLCGKNSVIRSEYLYKCTNTNCKAHLPRFVLKREVEMNEAINLITTGKTNIISGFTSEESGEPIEGVLLLEQAPNGAPVLLFQDVDGGISQIPIA